MKIPNSALLKLRALGLGKSLPKVLAIISEIGVLPLADEPPDIEPSQKLNKGTLLPHDWAPNEGDMNCGFQLGFSEHQILVFAEDMRLWAGANANRAVARKASWSATFKGWMRRQVNKSARPHEKGYAELADDLRSMNGGGGNGPSGFNEDPSDLF